MSDAKTIILEYVWVEYNASHLCLCIGSVWARCRMEHSLLPVMPSSLLFFLCLLLFWQRLVSQSVRNEGPGKRLFHGCCCCCLLFVVFCILQLVWEARTMHRESSCRSFFQDARLAHTPDEPRKISVTHSRLSCRCEICRRGYRFIARIRFPIYRYRNIHVPYPSTVYCC